MKPAPRAAGAVVFRRSERGIQLLLLRAYKNWDFPKGLVEPGENELDAAKREVREETGLEDLDFRWGEEFIETEPYSKNKVARYYLATSPAGAVKLPLSTELGRPEHHEYRWLGFENARRLVVPRLIPVLAWSAHRIGA